MVSLCQLLISVIGLCDLAMMTATVLGFTMILKVQIPEYAVEYFINVPTIDVWWFGFNVSGCVLFWISSINVVYYSLYSSPEIFRRQALAPWMMVGLFVLMLSLLGSAFEGDKITAVVMVIIRTAFLSTLWLCVERWEQEEARYVWHMKECDSPFPEGPQYYVKRVEEFTD